MDARRRPTLAADDHPPSPPPPPTPHPDVPMTPLPDTPAPDIPAPDTLSPDTAPPTVTAPRAPSSILPADKPLTRAAAAAARPVSVDSRRPPRATRSSINPAADVEAGVRTRSGAGGVVVTPEVRKRKVDESKPCGADAAPQKGEGERKQSTHEAGADTGAEVDKPEEGGAVGEVGEAAESNRIGKAGELDAEVDRNVRMPDREAAREEGKRGEMEATNEDVKNGEGREVENASEKVGEEGEVHVEVAKERKETHKTGRDAVITTETVQSVETTQKGAQQQVESLDVERSMDAKVGEKETEEEVGQKPSVAENFPPAPGNDMADVGITNVNASEEVPRTTAEASKESPPEKQNEAEMTGADDLDFIFKADPLLEDEDEEEEPDDQQKDPDAVVEPENEDERDREEGDDADIDPVKELDEQPADSVPDTQTSPHIARNTPTREVRNRPRTRSQTLSPTRLRPRKSEPEPRPSSPKPKKKKVRRPVVGDRLRVMWHVDDIYYAGVVDNVLSYRGKRFYDITYDSQEREYYLDLNVRKWRYIDGPNDDDETAHDDRRGDDEDKEMNEDDFPRRGDKVMVMWHVDREFYPGVVIEVLRVGNKLFHDVSYDKGDLEFFLDLRVRKWKYQKDHAGGGELKSTVSKQAKAQGKQTLKLKSGTKRKAPVNGRSPTPPSVETPSSAGERRASARIYTVERDTSPAVDPEKILRSKRRQSAPNTKDEWSRMDVIQPHSLSYAPLTTTPPSSPSPPSPLSPLPKVEPPEKSTATLGTGDELMLDMLDDFMAPLQTNPTERKKRPRGGDIDSIAADLVERKRLKASESANPEQMLDKLSSGTAICEPFVDKEIGRTLNIEKPSSPEPSSKDPSLGSALATNTVQEARVLEKFVISSQKGVPRDDTNDRETSNAIPQVALSSPNPVELSTAGQKNTKEGGNVVPTGDPPTCEKVALKESESGIEIKRSVDRLATEHADTNQVGLERSDMNSTASGHPVQENQAVDRCASTHPEKRSRSPESAVTGRREQAAWLRKERQAKDREESEFTPIRTSAVNRGGGSRFADEQHGIVWPQQSPKDLPSAERRSSAGSRSARRGMSRAAGVYGIGSDRSKPKTRVSDIVSVAGMVAKKWATEESASISESIELLDRQVTSVKRLQTATKKLRRQREKELERHEQKLSMPDANPLTTVDIAETVDLDAHLGDMKIQIVELLTRYRSAVEDREKKLKRQFESIRYQAKSQTTKLQQAFRATRSLDKDKLQELRGSRPSVKHITPASLSATEVGRRHSLPSAAEGEQVSKVKDALTQELRNELADVKGQSEYLAKEVRRLQSRERTLMEEKERTTAELTRMKFGLDLPALAESGRGQPNSLPKPAPVVAPAVALAPPAKKRPIVKTTDMSISQSLTQQPRPATGAAREQALDPQGSKMKSLPSKPAGIIKKYIGTKATSQKSPGRHSGRANRKTLPRSASKYKPPARAAPAEVKAKEDLPQRKSEPAPKPMANEPAIPTVNAQEKVNKNFPAQLGKQMDKQAAELLALIVSVWLLQDEGRTEPPKTLGEKQNKWVQGCVKGALRHAYGYLNTCNGGIMTAKRSLLDDVDGESVETGWIFAESDNGIEVARVNYSLWEPALLDEEWIVEKKVLNALNVCLRTAMSLTTAGRFSATIMYAKEIARRALTDFDSIAANNFQRIALPVTTDKPREVPVVTGASLTPVKGKTNASNTLAKADMKTLQPSVTTSGTRGTNKSVHSLTSPSAAAGPGKQPENTSVAVPPTSPTPTIPGAGMRVPISSTGETQGSATTLGDAEGKVRVVNRAVVATPSVQPEQAVSGSAVVSNGSALTPQKDVSIAVSGSVVGQAQQQQKQKAPSAKSLAASTVQAPRSSVEARVDILKSKQPSSKSSHPEEGPTTARRAGVSPPSFPVMTKRTAASPAITSPSVAIQSTAPGSSESGQSVGKVVATGGTLAPKSQSGMAKNASQNAEAVQDKSTRQGLESTQTVVEASASNGQSQTDKRQSQADKVGEELPKPSPETATASHHLKPKMPGSEASVPKRGAVKMSGTSAKGIAATADTLKNADDARIDASKDSGQSRPGNESSVIVKQKSGISESGPLQGVDQQKMKVVGDTRGPAERDVSFKPDSTLHPLQGAGDNVETPISTKGADSNAINSGALDPKASNVPPMKAPKHNERHPTPIASSTTVKKHVASGGIVREKQSVNARAQAKVLQPATSKPQSARETPPQASSLTSVPPQGGGKGAFKPSSSTKNRVYRTKGSALGSNSAGSFPLQLQVGISGSGAESGVKQHAPSAVTGNVTSTHGDGFVENSDNIGDISVSAMKGVSMKGIGLKGMALKGFNMEPPDFSSRGIVTPGVVFPSSKPPKSGAVQNEVRGPFMRSTSSPSTSRRTSQKTVMQSAAKRQQVGFKSISAPPRRRGGNDGPRQSTAGAPFQPRNPELVQPVERALQSQTLPATFEYGRQSGLQDVNVAPRTTSAPDSFRDRSREGESAQANVFSNEGTYGDLMNPPTPSSFPGLENFIPISEGTVALKRLSNEERESLPATPSDFATDRPTMGGIPSPINFERSTYQTSLDPFPSANRPLYANHTGGILHPNPIASGSSGLNHLMNPQQQQQQSQHFPQSQPHGGRGDTYSGTDPYMTFQQHQGSPYQRGPFQRGSH